MAKLDFRKIRNEYIRRSMRYANGVSMLYDQALSDIAREFALVDYNPDIVFSFSNYGKFGRVDGIMSRLEEQIQSVINVGIENEFGKAYEAHNELLKQVLGDNITTEVERAFAPRLTSGNAAKLYISETASNNITRSMRVWNGATLGQMETAVQEAMMEGMPAQQMAGLIEQYLNDPESCFRRFRIKTGVDADGKSMYGRKWMKRVRNEDGSTSWFDADPRDYPTGQGVYHSSYKNALRYTRTTTNIAYRTADYERYQTEDFVLGIEIRTTSNPTHKEDICDFLAGRYPKDFKWVGWHINCLCYQVPILATPEEVNAMADAIINGQNPYTVPVAGRVTDVPDNFKEWVADNQDRIQETIDNGKQLPYFLRDNQQYMNEAASFDYSSIKSSVKKLPGTAQSPVTADELLAMQHSVFDYAQSYAKVDDSIKDSLDALMNATDLNEQYRLTLELKQKCAAFTRLRLDETGKTDGLTFVGNLFDETVSYPLDRTIKGQHIVIDEVKGDFVLYKDKAGKEYSYIIDINPADVMSARDMKICVDSLPSAMKECYDRFTFVNFSNPLDPFWKVAYDDPKFVSFATDGRNITFYMPVDVDNFMYAVPHELGHSLDHQLGLSNIWKAAMDADQARWDAIYSIKTVHAPSKYALKSIGEDIAESFRLFVEDREQFKLEWPSRYNIIAAIRGMM